MVKEEQSLQPSEKTLSEAVLFAFEKVMHTHLIDVCEALEMLLEEHGNEEGLSKPDEAHTYVKCHSVNLLPCSC